MQHLQKSEIAGSIGACSSQSIHLSSEWITCSVRKDGEKALGQKALRNEIQKHAKSEAHIAASNILAEQNERKIELASLDSIEHSRELTERYLRTAYFIGYYNRAVTDYPDLVTLQSTNGIELGSILNSRLS